MYRIKQKPEDFIVEEITNVRPKDSGRYVYYKLTKRNYNTLTAIEHIASRLGINPRRIGFAGTKDRLAVTAQYISIDNVKKERVDAVDLKDIELEFFGYGDEPISLGDLEANRFEIRVYSDKKPRKIGKVINYFGEQRFSKHNVDIGLAIIKGNFKKAVDIISESDNEFSDTASEYLAKKPNDYIGVIRKIPKKLLMLYIHSCQSDIWNRTVERMASMGVEQEKVPLVGFGTELEGKSGEIISSILKQEGITQRDFIIRSIPELSSEGSDRDMFIEIKDLEINDKVKFTLQKGSYATVVIQQLFS